MDSAQSILNRDWFTFGRVFQDSTETLIVSYPTFFQAEVVFCSKLLVFLNFANCYRLLVGILLYGFLGMLIARKSEHAIW